MAGKAKPTSKARKPKLSAAAKRRRQMLRVYDSFADADQADREYWWSKTPAQRLRECERLRQLNYGYGKGQPLPRFQSVLRVVELATGRELDPAELKELLRH